MVKSYNKEAFDVLCITNIMVVTDKKSSLPLPQGNFGLPFVGETISFLRDPDFANKRHKQYGAVFKTHIFGRPTIYMSGSEANRFLFANENQYFAIAWPHTTKTLLGPASLALKTGVEHQQRRKLLSQAFQPRALADYVLTMADITHKYLQKWDNLGTLTWYPELRKYTFDVACKLLVGTDDAAESNFAKLFEEWCEGLFSLPISLPWTKFGKALRCRQQLLKLIEAIILERQQQPNSDRDALGLLLQARDEDGNGLSLAELKDQVLLLLFAGHETLTSAISRVRLALRERIFVYATSTTSRSFDKSTCRTTATRIRGTTHSRRSQANDLFRASSQRSLARNSSRWWWFSRSHKNL
jgi:retinoid hydroxylase